MQPDSQINLKSFVILARGKILYIASSRGLYLEQSGGAGTHMRGTIKGLRENGYEVLPIIGGDIFKTVVSSTSDKLSSSDKRSVRDLIKRVLPTKVRLLFRDIRTIIQDILLEKRTIGLIKAFRPDIIYERSGYLSIFGSRLSKMLDIPHFIESDGCMVEIINNDYGVFSLYLGNTLEKWKLRRADQIVVSNKGTISVIQNKYNISGGKC